MSLIARQSIKNTAITYLGFALGAVNTIFLFTVFFSAQGYGLVISITAVANILTPLLAMGTGNAIIRFYPRVGDKNKLISFALALPLMLTVPLFAASLSAPAFFSGLFPQSEQLPAFYFVVLAIAIFSIYFEVFYSLAQAKLASVFGVFLKEFFYRAACFVLLFAVYFNWIEETQFIYMLAASFALRTVIIFIHAYKLEPFKIVKFSFKKLRPVFVYGIYASLGVAVWASFLEIDKAMLPFYESLENEAYYTVASFIGIAIAVPYRGIYQIANPILSSAIAKRDAAKQASLYYKSSINALLVCGLLFLLVNCNINELYFFLPEQYKAAANVVLLISLAKLLDAACGLNGSFILYSKYFRWDLVFSLAMIVFIVASNMIFIPKWGITGAAFSTFCSLFLVNIFRLAFVWIKMKQQPFGVKTLWLTLLIAFLFIVFSCDFAVALHPLWLLFIKSSLICAIYCSAAYFAKFSPDANLWLGDRIKKVLKIS